MATTFTVGVAQIDCRLGDVEANLAAYERELREAKGRGIDLLVFPELSLTGYFLKDMVSTVALDAAAPALRRLRELSRETVAFVAGAVEETPEYRFYNSAMFFDGGELQHVHRKVYLPTYGLFDELRYLARGDRLGAFESRFGRSALLLCEDLWHPSTSYVAAMDRALTLIVPSASPIWGVERGEIPENAAYWQRVNRVTAESYGMHLVYANRVGFEDGVGFWGGSEILSPGGEVLARARYYEPDMIAAQIDLGIVRRKRIAAPMLRDENIDLTINELMRIRGREAVGVVKALPVASAATPRLVTKSARVAKTAKPAAKAVVKLASVRKLVKTPKVGESGKIAKTRKPAKTGKAARRR
ncbi:MAG: nitrilase-related carbon-nitrogen hydrolase [Candidatus Binatia bacterium]